VTTVSKYYGLSAGLSLPFLDVNVFADNELFIDPFAIRMGLGPPTFAAAANTCTETFFDEVTRCAVSTMGARQVRGLRLLQRFEELRETRLGMSAAGFDGHGGAEGVGQDIWDVLTGDAEVLVRVGVLKQIEDIPLFVPGVGSDITSDLTTRVIFHPLVDFTSAMVARFPELAGKTGVKVVHRQVWDPMAAAWTTIKVELPTVDGTPLLLVPKEWARHTLTLTGTRFYDTALLSHVQDQRATVTKDGKILKTPKDRLREEASLARSYDTIIRVVEDAYGKGTDVVEEFKRFARERYNATTDEQVKRRTA
jgi:hypothetical protein